MKVTEIFGALAGALLGAALFAANAQAGGAFAEGTACATQEKGERLPGIVHVTFEQTAIFPPDHPCAVANPPPECTPGNQPTDVEVTIRIENKDLRKTFFTAVNVGDLGGGSDVANPCRIIEVLLADQESENLTEQILGAFYGAAAGRTVGVRELTQLSDPAVEEVGDKLRYHALANVVVTVQ